MSDRLSRFCRGRVACGVAAVASVLALTSPPVSRTFAAEAGSDAATKPAVPEPAATATITTVRCKALKLSVAWKGAGVNAVDYYSGADPFLQARKDPAPARRSIEISLGKEWGGRKIDVRLFDKSAKLLDSKPVECKAAP